MLPLLSVLPVLPALAVLAVLSLLSLLFTRAFCQPAGRQGGPARPGGDAAGRPVSDVASKNILCTGDERIRGRRPYQGPDAFPPSRSPLGDRSPYPPQEAKS
ncbi:hypothetical protein SSP531S_02540 [Streptomyces spongiicola]|uniref:Uncharacterized protein n=1 Tax=Streptomyces spongiicola TaxID=1690221 RepID=A0A388SSQ3_9ACTN|nr:hypothetical protein SSP531S_02540 [Streptomyces spongiicola]